MANNKGKQFEEQFKENWKRCYPETWLFRLKDQMNGYKETSQNPCDFLAFTAENKLFMIECKSHEGASIPFSAIPQYERLLEYKDFVNVYPGILVWFVDKDVMYWVPITVAEKLYNSGEKSIGLRHVDKYNLIKIPTQKKRVYLEADYKSIFSNIDNLMEV